MAVNKQLIFIMVNKCSGQFVKLWESHYHLLSCKFLTTMLSTIPVKKCISESKFLIKKTPINSYYHQKYIHAKIKALSGKQPTAGF